MPLYEYSCAEHGNFERIVPMARSSEPASCPVCGIPCKKVFTMPALRGLSATIMKAHERNERSRQEPHVCGSTCSHKHSKPAAPKKNRDGSPAKPKLESYKGKRPWVIEHA